MNDVNEMRQKAISHCRKVARQNLEYFPTRMAELAPGVIAIEDRAGECDALFDPERWQFNHPRAWKPDPNRQIPLLQDSGMEVLQGVGGVPQISTIEEMVDFAKKHLSATRDETWHDAPQFFEF